MKKSIQYTFVIAGGLGALLLLGSFLLMPVIFASSLQSSHIEGNVPDDAQFDRVLLRDLKIFFGAMKGMENATITYELLRKEPTQTGISFPHYYLWVKVMVQGDVRCECAVRVNAVDRKKFEITDFISALALRENPLLADTIFPKVLIPNILRRARLRNVP